MSENPKCKITGPNNSFGTNPDLRQKEKKILRGILVKVGYSRSYLDEVKTKFNLDELAKILDILNAHQKDRPIESKKLIGILSTIKKDLQNKYDTEFITLLELISQMNFNKDKEYFVLETIVNRVRSFAKELKEDISKSGKYRDKKYLEDNGILIDLLIFILKKIKKNKNCDLHPEYDIDSNLEELLALIRYSVHRKIINYSIPSLGYSSALVSPYTLKKVIEAYS